MNYFQKSEWQCIYFSFVILDGNENGLFNITRTEDNSALITVSGRIDRESAAQHLLTVKCYKLASDEKKLNYLRPYNRQDPSERQILVVVEDIDDNSPVFEKNDVTIGKHFRTLRNFPKLNCNFFLKIGIRLNIPPDTSLITLQAKDMDSDSPPMEYYIGSITFTRLGKYDNEINHMNNTNDKIFRMDVKTGELKTTNAMQKFTDGYFNIIVYANNTENPAKRSNVTVRVGFRHFKNQNYFLLPTAVRRKSTGVTSSLNITGDSQF